MNTVQLMQIIDDIRYEKNLSKTNFFEIYSSKDEKARDYLYQQADEVRKQHYGTRIFLRGLIEVSNFCQNDCFYCGIRKSNPNVSRYRLTKSDLLLCCRNGYELGFRTFVIQGGEDPYFTDDILSDWINEIHNEFPDCAITLSVGERSKESYQRLYDAGCDRYLLRHETITESHYKKLHPYQMKLKERIACLRTLKEIGYQTGCGLMVGSPYQTWEHLFNDLLFMLEFQPHMVGIGPFIQHKETPFAKFSSGKLEDTLCMLALTRILLPKVLLPATTALATLDQFGREAGLRAGANVLMPNLSPQPVRKKYMLYNNKASLDGEAAENVQALSDWLESIGYQAVIDRGDAEV